MFKQLRGIIIANFIPKIRLNNNGDEQFWLNYL